MVRCFPYTLSFGQSSNAFCKISSFFKYIFAQLPCKKPTCPGEYFPAEIFELSFNPWCKIGWPPGHLDRVFRCNLTVTGFVTMFVLPPCIYPGYFFDYFIRDYFRFLDVIFYMWLLNFDIKPFCKLITDFDQDLKVIF